MPQTPRVIVDPFLGGGSVPLAAVVEGCVQEAVLCEKDDDVASVWEIIFSRDYRKLCDLIAGFDISRERAVEVLSAAPKSTLQRAFQTIVRNRVNRGGILARGASLVKVGENGRGVASRWYPQTFIRRIEQLSYFRESITFIHGDGLELMQQYAGDPQAFIFVDPPYTAGAGKRAGTRLYEHSEIDHESVFSMLAEGRSPFMMTYDDDPDVIRMSMRHDFVLRYVRMKNTHHRQMNELLITRSECSSASAAAAA